MSEKPDLRELTKHAEERTVGYLHAWLRDPVFKAALERSDNIASITPVNLRAITDKEAGQ